MAQRPLALVAAVSDDGVIGREGDLPWRIREDLARFKEITLGHALLMGRKTHESIGRPLPGRRNIVLTTREGARFDGCEVARSLEEALTLCADDPMPMVIGGEAVYAAALPLATHLFLTEVHRLVPDGDARFPAWDRTRFREVSREPARTEGVEFVVWERLD